MTLIHLMGFCLLAAAVVMVLRPMNASIAALLCAVFGVLVVSLLLPGISSYMEQIRIFLEALALDGAYYAIMLKAMGIVLITQMTVQICTDMDAPSIARRAELCGRLALLGVAMPVFLSLTQMAVDVLR